MSESVCYDCKRYILCKRGMRGYAMDEFDCSFFVSAE